MNELFKEIPKIKEEALITSFKKKHYIQKNIKYKKKKKKILYFRI